MVKMRIILTWIVLLVVVYPIALITVATDERYVDFTIDQYERLSRRQWSLAVMFFVVAIIAIALAIWTH